ncbi:MAG: DUF5683 domain-containing protein [Candidatus Cryptobacteroides sp.]|nr:DUF5683 domain-containing protein [Bacteroidales bacterium]MDY2772916.1 DUF5683 domain-containing protein [Candidatus Cryptobacteroides sp.]
MGRFRVFIAILAAGLCLCCVNAHAQFKDQAFQQNYNDSTTTEKADTTDKLFSFKELFQGLGHKKEIKIGTVFGGSLILPGSGQIYNRDYWKLPVVYGGIAACAGVGGYYTSQYKKSVAAGTPNETYKTTATWLYVGAGLVYWGSILDAAAFYPSNGKPNPGRAAIYSALLPGLGQAYNGEYWKIPVYYTGLMTAGYFVWNNNLNYNRFRNIYKEATSGETTYTGPITAEQAKYYRDSYRRLRDYSIVATALVYVLQIIDANVFAFMYDFEVSDDISMSVEPAVLAPDNVYAMRTPSSYGGNAVGMKIGFRF